MLDNCTFIFSVPTSCNGKKNTAMLNFTKTNTAHAQLRFMLSHWEKKKHHKHSPLVLNVSVAHIDDFCMIEILLKYCRHTSSQCAMSYYSCSAQSILMSPGHHVMWISTWLDRRNASWLCSISLPWWEESMSVSSHFPFHDSQRTTIQRAADCNINKV